MPDPAPDGDPAASPPVPDEDDEIDAATAKALAAPSAADAAGEPGADADADAADETGDDAAPSGGANANDELAADTHSGLDPGDAGAAVKVEDADGNAVSDSMYRASTTFEALSLSPELLKGIYAHNFAKPSQIQASSLPLILPADGEHRNLIAQAHNGSGKTACFVLGMLARVDLARAQPQAICLCPTRELARQIRDVVLKLGQFTGVTAHLAVKMGDSERADDSGDPITDPIVVGTPGRVSDLLKRRRIDSQTVCVLVLDEADEMVDTQGMGSQTIRIRRMLPARAQVLLFSATYREGVVQLAAKIAPKANRITVERERLSLKNVAQYFIDTGSREDRYNVLDELFAELSVSSTIIFVRTRATAAQLTNRLRAEGHTVSVLYGGDMTPAERDRVIDEFRQETTRVLITTNVLSRGVDVSSVSIVINYDMPTDRDGRNADPETYLHRIGRSGRFGRKGLAVNFVYDSHSKRVVKELETYYKHPIEKADDAEALAKLIKEM